MLGVVTAGTTTGSHPTSETPLVLDERQVVPRHGGTVRRFGGGATCLEGKDNKEVWGGSGVRWGPAFASVSVAEERREPLLKG